jgi:hypothetical protein
VLFLRLRSLNTLHGAPLGWPSEFCNNVRRRRSLSQRTLYGLQGHLSATEGAFFFANSN